jgi:D-alanyl-D-alanine carboxypeptidase
MKSLRFFLIGLGVTSLFCFGLNFSQAKLEGFLVSQWAVGPEVLTAEIPKKPAMAENDKPTNDFKVEAKSGLVLVLALDGSRKVVFDYNSDQKMPIASLTKLMTAVVSVESLPLSQKVVISETCVHQAGSAGDLKPGEKIAVRELLKMALVESSNDAAEALAEAYGREQFIELMNLKAGELGLGSTHFATPTGLEADSNFSTARDLTNLTLYIMDSHPLIMEISRQESLVVVSENETIHHRALNTNELLANFAEITNGELEIVGGKTGYTQEAGGCIILVTKDNAGDYFVNVVLGSSSWESRFLEMEKLVKNFNQ